jgi:predicted RNase H-like HicB family nuclease
LHVSQYIKKYQEKIMHLIDFDIMVFKEDETFVSYCPELDISSCGDSIEHAKEMLKTAVRLFIEEAEKMGTLKDILQEANFKEDSTGRWVPPRLVATELVSIS